MKKLFVFAALLISLTSTAQQKKTTTPAKPAAKSPAKPAATTPVLKTLADSASYAIGLSVANFYKQQGIAKVNAAMVSKAINDVTNGKKALLDDHQANNIIMKYINEAQASKAQPNIKSGRDFLAKNKSKAGVKTTASGLQYEVITEGTGIKPTANDSVTVNYVGTLINGNEFDNSYKRGQPITFPLSGVIRGWTEGLQLMPQGSKYKFYIPHELGYGLNDMGSIPAGSVLVFEVDLLKVAPKQ